MRLFVKKGLGCAQNLGAVVAGMDSFARLGMSYFFGFKFLFLMRVKYGGGGGSHNK